MSGRNLRCFEDVKKSLESRLSDYELEQKLWNEVKVLKKKDGTDFSNRSKSFENASWTIPAYQDAHHPELKVCGRNERGEWKEFTLYMYDYADELSEGDERKTRAEGGNTFTRATVVLTPDEAMIRIGYRVLNIVSASYALKKQLEELERIYDEFFTAIEDAFKGLKENCKGFRSNDNIPSTIEYMLLDVLENSGYRLMK